MPWSWRKLPDHRGIHGTTGDWADIEKNRPEEVVRVALEGIEHGQLEILADDISAQVKAGLAKDPAEVYPQVVGAR